MERLEARVERLEEVRERTRSTQMATSQAKALKLVYEQESVQVRVGRLKNAVGQLHES